jgi:hypothetical protein
MKKKMLLSKGAFLLLMGLQMSNVHAQQKIGGAVGAADPNAYLQLGDATGANKGLLISRVALTGTTAAAPLSAFVAGMVVYNTATAGTAPANVTPGYYYCDGTQWVRLAGVGAAGTQSWYSTKTLAPSTANTDSVYVMGRVGIGTSAPQAGYWLDVRNGDALINGLTVGRGAGNASTNFAGGSQALASNTTGTSNVGVGNKALLIIQRE